MLNGLTERKESKMTINETQDEIIEEFSLFDNRNDQYAYIIELGKKLTELEEEYRTEQNIVKGCQSKVWLQPGFSDGKVQFRADSDSTLVKGLVGLLVRVLSERTPEEINTAELYFVDKIGLREMLSMNRSNGLSAMIKQMRLYAIAYQAKYSN